MPKRRTEDVVHVLMTDQTEQVGKVLLFLGLGVAILVFFFATCLVVPAL